MNGWRISWAILGGLWVAWAAHLNHGWWLWLAMALNGAVYGLSAALCDRGLALAKTTRDLLDELKEHEAKS